MDIPDSQTPGDIDPPIAPEHPETESDVAMLRDFVRKAIAEGLVHPMTAVLNGRLLISPRIWPDSEKSPRD